jgi:hypothetical protein
MWGPHSDRLNTLNSDILRALSSVLRWNFDTFCVYVRREEKVLYDFFAAFCCSVVKNDFRVWDLRHSQRCCQRFESSGMLRSVVGWVVYDVSKDRSPFMFRVKLTSILPGLLDPEDEGSTIFRNVVNYLLHQRHSVPFQKFPFLRFYLISCQLSDVWAFRKANRRSDAAVWLVMLCPPWPLCRTVRRHVQWAVEVSALRINRLGREDNLSSVCK